MRLESFQRLLLMVLLTVLVVILLCVMAVQAGMACGWTQTLWMMTIGGIELLSEKR